MHIVKVPGINGLGKTDGCEKAGNAILKCLKEEIYSSEAGKPIDFDLLNLEESHVDNLNVEAAQKLIYKNCLEMFENNSKTIFIGGDHSISYSIGKAFLDNCRREGKESCLIVFDSHADCMKPMGVESEDSSCFPYKFGREPTNGAWLRALIESGFPAGNILLVGARNLHREEIKYLAERKIKQININSIVEDIDNIADTIMEFANGRDTYVSIDIDIIDSAFAPAVSYAEAGGLSSREFIYLIQRINKIKTLRGIDLVEVNPLKDLNGMTVKLGARILGEFI